MKNKINFIKGLLKIFLIIKIIWIIILIFIFESNFLKVVLLLILSIFIISFIGFLLKKTWGSLIIIIISVIDLIFSFGFPSSELHVIVFIYDLFLIILAYNEKKLSKPNIDIIPKLPTYERSCQSCGNRLKLKDKFCPTCGLKRKFNLFFSFSHLDSDYFKINNIAASLENRSEINKIFYSDSNRGLNVVQNIGETLKKCEIFILFCSENALKSKGVEEEWKLAYQMKNYELIKIVPICENEKFIPYLLTPLLFVRFNINQFDVFIIELYNNILRN